MQSENRCAILAEIKEYQYPKFTGAVNHEQTVFESPASAASAVKRKAFELGADEVGIAEIEPTDIYKNREVNEKYATGKCFPYFAAHNYCSICLPVCVYHHKATVK